MNGMEPFARAVKELEVWVRKEIGPIAKPDLIQWAPGLPKTRSGKIMRRILRKIAENDFGALGDTSTLADPSVVDDLIASFRNASTHPMWLPAPSLTGSRAPPLRPRRSMRCWRRAASRSTPSSALRSMTRRWSSASRAATPARLCGEGYHDSFKQPATDGVCDKCGGTDMKRRADDNAETVRTRLSAYHADTAPLIDYYAARGTLTAVPAMGDIGEIAGAMNAIVSPLTTA
jgi:hypothetical protein